MKRIRLITRSNIKRNSRNFFNINIIQQIIEEIYRIMQIILRRKCNSIMQLHVFVNVNAVNFYYLTLYFSTVSKIVIDFNKS